MILQKRPPLYRRKLFENYESNNLLGYKEVRSWRIFTQNSCLLTPVVVTLPGNRNISDTIRFHGTTLDWTTGILERKEFRWRYSDRHWRKFGVKTQEEIRGSLEQWDCWQPLGLEAGNDSFPGAFMRSTVLPASLPQTLGPGVWRINVCCLEPTQLFSYYYLLC